ncbi:MAG: DUF2231 domain-containing protein [Candidatus Latescibacterota bacterium]
MLPAWAPNVHPLIVHFPLALLLVGALVDLVALLLPEQHGLRRSAVGLYVLGAVGAIAAAVTGNAAVDSVPLSPEAIPAAVEHEEWGERTAWLFGILTPIRMLAHWGYLDRTRWIHLVFVLLAAAGCFLLYEAGEHGAELVFAHGVGVRTAPPAAAGEPAGIGQAATPEPVPSVPTELGPAPGGAAAPVPAEEGPAFSTQEDGSWTWNPGAAGGDSLAGRVDWLTGSPSALNVIPAAGDGLGRVVRLQVRQTPAAFVGGSPLDGVLVQVRLNLDAFDGTVMVMHNVLDRDRYHFLSLEDGQLRLGVARGGTTLVLAQGQFEGEGWLNVRLVASESHFRGYVGNDLVAHGHGEDPPAGRVGLRLQGTGSVLVDRLQVSPVPSGEAGH